MLFSKASGLNDSIYGKSLNPIKMFLQEQEEAYKKGSKIDEIFYVLKSDKYGEKFSSFTSKGDFVPVGENGEYPRTAQQVGYEKFIEPDTWKLSFEVTEEMLEDAKMFDVKAKAADFMLSYYRTREKFAASLLNNATATTMTYAGVTYDITGADSLALFSAAHTSKTGNTGNQSNLSTNLAFSYDNLATVEEYMQKFTDDDGNLLNIQPDTIVIPNNARIKKLVSDVVFTDSGKPGTTDNSFNFHGERWNVVVWNQMTTPSGASYDPWMLLDSKRNQIYPSFVFLDRVPLSVRTWINDETGSNIWGGRARFGAAPVDWRNVYLSRTTA